MTVQLALGAIIEGQLFVCEKLPLPPEIYTEVNDSDWLPMLVRVVVCGVLLVPIFCGAKVKTAGEKLASGPSCPMPCRLIVVGVLLPECERVMVPNRVPANVGVNVTVIVQFPPPGRPAPQVLVWAKSPVTWMLVIVSAALPMLRITTLFELPVVPTPW